MLDPLDKPYIEACDSGIMRKVARVFRTKRMNVAIWSHVTTIDIAAYLQQLLNIHINIAAPVFKDNIHKMSFEMVAWNLATFKLPFNIDHYVYDVFENMIQHNCSEGVFQAVCDKIVNPKDNRLVMRVLDRLLTVMRFNKRDSDIVWLNHGLISVMQEYNANPLSLLYKCVDNKFFYLFNYLCKPGQINQHGRIMVAVITNPILYMHAVKNNNIDENDIILALKTLQPYHEIDLSIIDTVCRNYKHLTPQVLEILKSRTDICAIIKHRHC